METYTHTIPLRKWISTVITILKQEHDIEVYRKALEIFGQKISLDEVKESSREEVLEHVSNILKKEISNTESKKIDKTTVISQLNGILQSSSFFLPVQDTLQDYYLKKPRLFVGSFSGHGFIFTPKWRLFCFGKNYRYQLGLNDDDDRLSPVLHPILSFYSISKISCGSNHSLVLLSSGSVLSCGSCLFGQTCQGITSTRYRRDFVRMPQIISSLKSVTDVFCGELNSFFITDDKVFGGGSGKMGQLGTRKEEDESTPVEIKIPKKVKSISAGEEHTLFLSVDGEVFVTGDNSEGRTGLSSRVLTPTELKFDVKVKKIGCGSRVSFFLLDNNELHLTGGFGKSWKTIITTPEVYCKSVKDFSCGKSHVIVNITTKFYSALYKPKLYYSAGYHGSFSCGKLGNREKTTLFTDIIGKAIGNVLEETFRGRKKDDGDPLYELLSLPLGDSQVADFHAVRDNSYFVLKSFDVYACGKGEQGQMWHREKLKNYFKLECIAKRIRKTGDGTIDVKLKDLKKKVVQQGEISVFSDQELKELCKIRPKSFFGDWGVDIIEALKCVVKYEKVYLRFVKFSKKITHIIRSGMTSRQVSMGEAKKINNFCANIEMFAGAFLSKEFSKFKKKWEFLKVKIESEKLCVHQFKTIRSLAERFIVGDDTIDFETEKSQLNEKSSELLDGWDSLESSSRNRFEVLKPDFEEEVATEFLGLTIWKQKVVEPRTVYFGQLNEKGEKDGVGIEFNPKFRGIVYCGEFKSGTKEGKGIEFYPDTGVVKRKGKFLHGEYFLEHFMKKLKLLKEIDIDKEVKFVEVRPSGRPKSIGSGGMADVYKVEFEGVVRCAKISKRRNERIEMYKECALLFVLDHPNIIKAFAFSKEGPDAELGYIMEFCEFGSVDKVIKKGIPGKFDLLLLENKLSILYQVVQGMIYLHECLIVHFDLKWENVLLDSKFTVKICDFGISDNVNATFTVKNTNWKDTYKGTACYIAPEVVRERYKARERKKCDVFSFGIMIYCMLCNTNNPFNITQKMSQNCVIKFCEKYSKASVHSDYKNFRPKYPQEMEEDEKTKWLVDLSKKCWDDDPNVRPTFEEIKRDFQKYCKFN